MDEQKVTKVRTVGTIILYNKKDRTILMQRRPSKDGQSGRLSLFGGGLEEGESFKEGMKREAMEELSYTLKNPVLFETENNIAGQTDYFGVVYLEEYDESQSIQIDHESAEAVWTTIDKALLEPHMAPYRREGLKRLKIHMEGIWGKEEISEVRKLANVILYRKSDKKILLQRRSEKSKKFPGYLGPFGGHLEVGEDFVAGLKRELMEELGYKVQKPVLLEEWSNELGGTKYIGQTFIEEFDDTQEIQVNDESEQAEWVSLEEALAETRMLGHRKETLLKLKPVLEKVWGEKNKETGFLR